MSRPPIPKKRLREVKNVLKQLKRPYKLVTRFTNEITGDSLTAGGIWCNVKKRYLRDDELIRLPAEVQEYLISQPMKEMFLSQPQWDFLLYCFMGLLNYDRMSRGKDPLQVVMLHGARRTGKSWALYGGIKFVALARPAANIWVVGLRKRHGQKIISKIRQSMAYEQHTYDRKEQLLTLINSSKIYSKASVNYDADRGDELDLLALDEGAFMKEEVFDTLMPSTTSVNGFTVIASSPNQLNWFHQKKELTRFSKESAEAIKTVHLTPIDNVFNPIVAERAELARHVMSEERWRQEMQGEFSETDGLAFPKFDPETHIRDWALIDDYTEDVCARMGGRQYKGKKWIVGVDYNINPTCGAIMKIDKSGQIWYCAEVAHRDGTDQFGNALYDKCIELGIDEPYKEVLLIGDSSGERQDPRDKKNSQSAQILRSQGWVVELPHKRRRNNPRRSNKLEVMRALNCNAADDAHMFVDPSCKKLIDMFTYLDLNKSKQNETNRSSPHNHWYDSAAYPVWRVWGDQDTRRSPTLGQKIFKKVLVEANWERL